MKKIKLLLQVFLSAVAILLLNHLNGTVFELPEFLEQWLDIALVFVYVLVVFAFMKFMDIVFTFIDSGDNDREQAHEEN